MSARSTASRLAALGLGIAVALVLLEAGARLLFGASAGELPRDERNLLYRHDPELGWFPLPDLDRGFTGSRTIRVRSNALGFRDPEHEADERPTLLILGDSFAWGYDVEAHERFDHLLRARLPGWALRNLGVSGYGTDQQWLLLRRFGARLRPQRVLLLFGPRTDRHENRTNLVHDGYFKPWVTVEGERLQLQGTPVPRSTRYAARLGPLGRSVFLRRLLSFVPAGEAARVRVPDPTLALLREIERYTREELGAELALGLIARDREVEAWCRHRGLACLDLTTHLRYPTHGQHWNAEGHRFVAERLYEHYRTERDD